MQYSHTHHLFELLVGKCILLLQLILLDGKGGLQLVHLVHRLPDLLQAHIQVQLLLLQVTPLLVIQFDLQGKTKNSKHARHCLIKEH